MKIIWRVFLQQYYTHNSIQQYCSSTVSTRNDRVYNSAIWYPVEIISKSETICIRHLSGSDRTSLVLLSSHSLALLIKVDFLCPPSHTETADESPPRCMCLWRLAEPTLKCNNKYHFHKVVVTYGNHSQFPSSISLFIPSSLYCYDRTKGQRQHGLIISDTL